MKRSKRAVALDAQRLNQPDGGFTLVEMLTALAVFGVASATAVTGLRAWASSLDERGGAQSVVADLRRAQQEAVTEGRPFCVDFNATSNDYAVFRGACDDAGRSRVRGPILLPTGARLVAPSFTGTSGIGTGVTFLPRGTAWAGSVQLTRSNASKTYTISVEALTGRVSVA
jgi:prepilin-type N-terminal cleavage/methylation domain-containing protein